MQLMHIEDTDTLLAAMRQRAEVARARLVELQERVDKQGAYGMAWCHDDMMSAATRLEVSEKAIDAISNLTTEGADWHMMRAHLRKWILNTIIEKARDRSRATTDSHNRYERAKLQAWASLMDDLQWVD